MTGVFLAGDVDHALMYESLIARVHALVDLVYDSKRRFGARLQCHQVEYCAHCTLSTRLPMGVEYGQRLIFTRRVRFESNNNLDVRTEI